MCGSDSQLRMRLADRLANMVPAAAAIGEPLAT